MEDVRAIKAASRGPALDDLAKGPLQGQHSAMARLVVAGMEPQCPGLAVEGRPLQSPDFLRTHPGPAEPLNEVFDVGVSEVRQDAGELRSVEKPLPCVVLGKSRELRGDGYCAGFQCESEGPLESL